VDYIATVFLLVRYNLCILIFYSYSFFFQYINLTEGNKEEIMAVAIIDLFGKAEEILEI
jgi:hypothetical protein